MAVNLSIKGSFYLEHSSNTFSFDLTLQVIKEGRAPRRRSFCCPAIARHYIGLVNNCLTSNHVIGKNPCETFFTAFRLSSNLEETLRL